VPEARELIFKNELCIGTIDSWLIWKLTHGKQFITDYSNASRTNMFNIQSLEWDRDLLNYYEIPMSILPQVRDSIGTIGYSEFDIFGAEIPISSIAGDQQAALYGHQCFETGSLKNTFGTGCFLLQNIGSKFRLSENKLLTTIGWKEQAEIVYAIEGSVFNAGSALKWLKENLQLIQSYEEIEDVCHSIPDTEGVYFVPAFTGLGAPHWDMYARGTIVGMTRNTDRRHIIRATIESIAFQTKDIVDTMKKDSGLDFDKLKVDGGVSESKFLLQFLADILQIPIIHSESKECTALGAAMMAAKGIGLADNPPTIDAASNQIVYNPDMGYDESKQHYKRWEDALERSKGWAIKG
jgi:glycerol kinase